MRNTQAIFALSALLGSGICLAQTAPSPSLPGPLVILDPGHGGKDWGAIAAGRMEKDICLAVAQKLKERLEKTLGVSVRLTRDSDTFLRLDERVNRSLNADQALFISLHVNKVRNKKMTGITVYTFGRKNSRSRMRRRHRGIPPLPAPPLQQAHVSAEIAAALVRSLREEGFRVDPLAHAQYYVLKNPEHPSILIEMGYLSNAQEAARLADPAYQDKLAGALARSLDPYLSRPQEHFSSSVIASAKSRRGKLD